VVANGKENVHGMRSNWDMLQFSDEELDAGYIGGERDCQMVALRFTGLSGTNIGGGERKRKKVRGLTE